MKLVELGALGPKQILEERKKTTSDGEYDHPLKTTLLSVNAETSEETSQVDDSADKSSVMPKVIWVRP